MCKSKHKSSGTSIIIVNTIGNHLTVLIGEVPLIQGNFSTELPQLKASIDIREVSTVKGFTIMQVIVN